VTSLRSSRQIERPDPPTRITLLPKKTPEMSSPPPTQTEELEEPKEPEASKEPESIASDKTFTQDITTTRYVPKVPFLKRLLIRNKSNIYEEIREVFQNVHISIPFLTTIAHIPAYSKFLKDLCTTRRRPNVPYDTFLLQESAPALTQVTKYRNPRSTTISCQIGGHFTANALLDLGASVNLLPLYLYRQLGLKSMKPNPITLRLADRSIL